MTEKKMPDFNSLSDRVIAKHTPQPIFAIKTNLDPVDPSEENPYYSHVKDQKEKEKLDNYFGRS